MAERRMFAKTIVLSDAFLDMPLSARCLYFTLGMLADDDGFVNSPKSIMRQCGAGEDDMKILLAKKFLLYFETGVIVIKHWKIHNYIQKDRYKETKYIKEKNQLVVDNSNIYRKKEDCIQNVYITDTQVRLGKDSLDKVSIDEDSIEVVEVKEKNVVSSYSSTPTTSTTESEQKLYGEYGNVLLTKTQYQKLLGLCMSQKLLDELIKNLSENIEVGKEEPYKAHLPNAHYIKLVKYFDYRRKNPDKFMLPTETKSKAAEVTEKWYEEMKGRGYGA